MLLSFIKITLRNFYKEKMYAAINIFGLSLGIACCIILGLYLHSELTYDRHNLKHKQIYRVMGEFNFSGKIENWSDFPWELGPLLAKDYPQVKEYVRFNFRDRTLFLHEKKGFYWEHICMADKNVFEIFTHDIIYGDPKTALSEPYSMAVSGTFAKKYFSNANPIGKIVTANGTSYKITLVFADLPENTHLKYDGIISCNRSQNGEAQPYIMRFAQYFYFSTYLLMPEGYNPESFSDIAGHINDRHLKEKLKKGGLSGRLWLQPLADIHLKSDPKIKIYFYGLSSVAIFILLIACINYMNLATARFMKRGREVGMRKVLGATRWQLIAQFLGESIFFALIALVIGLVIVEAVTAITPINDLLGKHELMNFIDKPAMLLCMLAFSIFVGLISGSYPAFYLSSALPIATLTGTTHSGKKGSTIRQILVFIQFIISITVIASTILMALQMRYVANKPLGFSKENKLIITMHGPDLISKVQTLKQELLKDSSISAIAETHEMVSGSAYGNPFIVENNDGVMEKQSIMMGHMFVGEDFIKVMEIELIAGNNVSHKLWSSTIRAILVNETQVKRMGWKEPLGKNIQFNGGKFTVIGVVKDFHFRSLHQQIEPLVIMTWSTGFNYSSLEPEERANQWRLLVLNISREKVSKTLNYIKEVFEKFDPEHPFEYSFLDEELDRLYRSEQRVIKLIGTFSGICILISCLGLFGLAAFTTEQRTKEIGVRKVLGSSTFQIIVMLSRGILFIVLAASVIASLIAYFIIDEWLTGFAYHTGINPLVFVLSAAFAMTLAFGTVALQAFKTANENPVKALRYE